MAVTEANPGEVNMDESTHPLLCDPETHDSLPPDASALLNPKSGMRYPIREAFPFSSKPRPVRTRSIRNSTTGSLSSTTPEKLFTVGCSANMTFAQAT